MVPLREGDVKGGTDLEQQVTSSAWNIWTSRRGAWDETSLGGMASGGVDKRDWM